MNFYSVRFKQDLSVANTYMKASC